MSTSNTQEDVYIEYLNYDWDSFQEFQDGLQEIMDNYLQNLKEQDPSVTSIPNLDKQQLINQAKSFFFCNKTGNIINLDDFEDWKLHNEDKFKKDKQIEELGTSESSTSTNNQSDSDPPYSSNYQELVGLLMLGKPIPGIKQILDTVLTDQGSTASASQRTKPWEKNRLPETTEEVSFV